MRQATLSEDTDKVLQFMEEFIKRQLGMPKPRDNAVFRELSESDRECVNELLRNCGI